MFQFQKNMGEHDIQTSKRKLKEFISPCIQTAIKNHKPEDLESENNWYILMDRILDLQELIL